MALHFHPSRNAASSCIGILFFFVLLLPPPARAVEPRPLVPVTAAVVSRPLPAKGWTWTHIQSAVGSRRRMVQFATIGMCIGLFILMRK